MIMNGQNNARKPSGWIAVIITSILVLFTSGCTEETRNKWSRQADNLLGKDLRVSYIDGGQVVKSWVVEDGKITSGKDEQGRTAGYYYFWAVDTGYVQLPIERTLIEEIRSR